MAFKDITEGDKIAKARSARYIKSSKGTEGIEVTFEFEEPSGEMEFLKWTGWLTEKAGEKTQETLLNVLGCNGNFKARNNSGDFLDKNFLAYDREVKLVVEMEERKDEYGRTVFADNTDKPIFTPRIKWVNAIGGSGYVGCSVDEMGPGLAFLQANALASGKKPEPKFTEEEVPF